MLYTWNIYNSIIFQCEKNYSWTTEFLFTKIRKNKMSKFLIFFNTFKNKIKFIFPYSNILFLYGCFQGFFLFFSFQALIILLEFIRFGIHSVSWICKFMPLTKIWKFSPIISSCTLSPPLSFLSFCDSNDTNVISFFLVPPVLWFCSLFSIYFVSKLSLNASKLSSSSLILLSSSILSLSTF